MEFLSQSVAGKAQECMAGVEDGELMSGSVSHRVHRAPSGCLVHGSDCACALRSPSEQPLAMRSECLTTSQLCLNIMPEHSAPPGLPVLQQYQPWKSADVLCRSFKQRVAAAWLQCVCAHTQHGVIVECRVPVHARSMGQQVCCNAPDETMACQSVHNHLQALCLAAVQPTTL